MRYNRRRSRKNPITTFTNEQAAYLVVGGIAAASVFGYLLYQAGKNAQQIVDLQAQLPSSTAQGG
jgi:hypothetical protein